MATTAFAKVCSVPVTTSRSDGGSFMGQAVWRKEDPAMASEAESGMAGWFRQVEAACTGGVSPMVSYTYSV